MQIDHSTSQLHNSEEGIHFGFSNDQVPPKFWIETRFVIPTSPGSWNVGVVFGASAPVAKPNGWAVTVSQVTASEMRLRFFQVVAGMFIAQNADRILSATGSLRLGVRVDGQDISIITTTEQSSNTEVIAFPNTLPGGLQTPTSWGVTTNGPALVAFDYMTSLRH